MAATEQINIRLDPGERERLAAAARKAGTTISGYARGRIFGHQVTREHTELLLAIASLKPMVDAAARRLDDCLAQIRETRQVELRPSEQAIAERARKELSTPALEALARRLGVSR